MYLFILSYTRLWVSITLFTCVVHFPLFTPSKYRSQIDSLCYQYHHLSFAPLFCFHLFYICGCKSEDRYYETTQDRMTRGPSALHRRSRWRNSFQRARSTSPGWPAWGSPSRWASPRLLHTRSSEGEWQGERWATHFAPHTIFQTIYTLAFFTCTRQPERAGINIMNVGGRNMRCY